MRLISGVIEISPQQPLPHPAKKPLLQPTAHRQHYPAPNNVFLLVFTLGSF